MSYTSLVQSDSPIGYWKLNGSTQDLSLYNNTASISSNIRYSALPLVANSGSAMIISPTTGSVVIANNYNAFHKGFERSNFTIEFWLSLDSSTMTGAGYTINNSSATQYFINDQLKIIQLLNGSTEVGSIYYDYNKNSFRFKINDTSGNNTESSYVVRNLNTSYYIVATYKDKSVSISVNGDLGLSGEITDFSLFPAQGASNYNFVISPNSINSSASMSYVINDLAFYDYKLPLLSMRKKTTWAYHNDKPNLLTTTLNTSLFELEEFDSNVCYYTEVLGNNFLENKEIFNLKVNEFEGLTNKHELNFNLDNSINFLASATYSSDGVSLYNSANLTINEFGTTVENGGVVSFTSQIKFGGSSDYIFSFNQKSNNLIYYSVVDSGGFYFYYYDLVAASSTLLSTLATSLTSGITYNFGICISDTINMYANSTSSTVANPLNIKVESDSILNIGNMVASPNSSNSLKIKNFGFSDLLISDFSTVDFTQNTMFMAKFTDGLYVSQIGYWIKTLSLSQFNNIIGSKITWDGMDNVKVELSNDNGFTWYPITRGAPIPYIIASSINKDYLVKVTVPFDYKIERMNQSFNNLQISIYNNLTFFTNDKNYEFFTQVDSSSSQPISIQRKTQAINYRKDNFGIKFNPETGSSNYVPGYGYIKNLTSAINTYGMDFWFKPNSFSSASNYVVHVDYLTITNNLYDNVYLDTYSSSTTLNSASTEYYLYVDNSTKKLIYSPSATAKLYVNGNFVASNSTSINIGDYYHLFLDFGTASGYDLNSTTTINGLYNTASGHSHFVYGNINMWNRLMTSGDAYSRFLSYVGNTSSSVSDTSSVIWQQNRYSSASVSASGIKIG